MIKMTLIQVRMESESKEEYKNYLKLLEQLWKWHFQWKLIQEKENNMDEIGLIDY